MSLITLAVAATLFSLGTYLVLQRMLSRVIIGLGLMSHGANLLIMLSGSGPAVPPVVDDSAPATLADDDSKRRQRRTESAPAPAAPRSGRRPRRRPRKPAVRVSRASTTPSKARLPS